MTDDHEHAGTLSDQHAAVAMIGVFTAAGDLPRLTTALNQGLDAGVTVNQVKEVLVQMYAYAGFPRSLNGISTFMAGADKSRRAPPGAVIAERVRAYTEPPRSIRPA